MASALAEVKKDLGPDAVIVRTRSYRTGGVLGFGGNTIVEITAASDSAEITTRPAKRPAEQQPPPTPTTTRNAGTSGSGGAPSANGAAENTAPKSLAPTPRRAVVPASPVDVTPPTLPDFEVPIARSEPPRAHTPGLAPTRVRFAPESDDAHAALEGELASIRRMVGEVLQTARRTAAHVDSETFLSASSAGRASPLSDMYSHLCAQDVPASWIDDVIADARADLSAAEAEDAGIVRETVARLLAARFRVCAPIEPTPGTPVVEALIGPTGVGKTTTIAKLAAVHKLRYGRRVGLITADTYRIAAVEQLRTYAGIIGIPLEVVLTPDEMSTAVERLSACDVVLIDTPGRSPRDGARLDELRAFLGAASPAVSCPVRTHLVVSAIASTGVLRSVTERFAPLGADGVLVTKLDEADTLGVLCHAAELTGLPFTSITTGQEVPDHIEPARAERLARLVLKGGLGDETAPGAGGAA